VAREFLAVLEVLAEHPNAALSVWVYLAAQTLECTLKAYVTKLGLQAPVRRKGHDLSTFGAPRRKRAPRRRRSSAFPCVRRNGA
jgi:hypothetical protein